MASEVQIHTWCDIEFSGDEEPTRVPGQPVNWFVGGRRMVIDMCRNHRSGTNIDMMDELVEQYGRPWEDPNAPVKVKSSKRTRARGDYALVQAKVDENGEFVCIVPDCPRDMKPLETIQGLRMHQGRVHGFRLKPEEKVK